MSDADAIDPLVLMLTDHAEDVRANALLGLAVLNEASVTQSIAPLTSDESLNVSLQAVDTLAQLGGSDAVAALRDVAANNAVEKVRQFAEEALIALGANEPHNE